MKIGFRRVVSVLCALALWTSMIPVSALAEPTETAGQTAAVQQEESPAPDAAADARPSDGAAVPEETDMPAEGAEDAVPAADDAAESDAAGTDAEQEKPVGEEPFTEPELPAPDNSADPETEDSGTEFPADEPAEAARSDAGPGESGQASEEAQAGEAAADTEDAADVVDSPAEARSSSTAEVTVRLGQTTTYSGRGTDNWYHRWSIEAGSGVVRIRENGSRVEITGLQTGTAKLRHTYGWGYTEVVTVTVTKAVTGNRSVFLFVTKPGNTTLSNVGSDYYYLASGGQASERASPYTFVKNTANEEAITQYVQTWPTELDFLTGTSSSSVDGGSSWTIDSSTGEVSRFDLYLDGERYSSDAYGIRWAKFSYADTAAYGSQYHVDAILYEKQTVENVIVNELGAKKLLSSFSLNDKGEENTSENFSFKIVDLNDDNTVKGDVEIPLSASVGRTNHAVPLDAGSHGTDILLPGRYLLYEEQNASDPVWQTADSVIFEVYTNGTVNVLSGGSKGNIVITNTPRTYSLSYDLNGGTGTISGVPGLKYNARTAVSGETPVRQDSVFLGWSTRQGGTVDYTSGAELQIKGDMTLYAVWGDASVTKSLVLTNTPVDSIVDRNDYAHVIREDGNCVTYTADGTAEILYRVDVKAYPGASVRITDQPANGQVYYVAAVGADTADGGKTFTMADGTAALYYKVLVTGVADRTVAGNKVDWTIATRNGTSEAENVTVIRTDKTARVEKKILQVVRGGETLGDVTDETVLRAGDVVTYEIKVTNTSRDALENVRISDTIHASGTLPDQAECRTGDSPAETMPAIWTEGTGGNHTAVWSVGTLGYDVETDTGETAVITYSYTVTDGDRSSPDVRDLVNTAAVIGAKAEPDSDLRTENFVEVPEIEVEKSGTVQVGQDGAMQIAYTVSVTNRGNVPLTGIRLQDARFPREISVSNDGKEVAGTKLSLSGDIITVSDTLERGKTLTVEYLSPVTETPDAEGRLQVENTVAVTAETFHGAAAADRDTAVTEVYSGTVRVGLAPIVIYMGGDGTTQAIIGADGRPVDGDDSGLPLFGITMTMPDGSSVDVTADGVAAELYDISTSDSVRAGYHWSAIAYNANATILMQLTPEGDTEAARIQLTGDDGKVITSDQFTIGRALCQNYTTELYAAHLSDTVIVAEIDGRFYRTAYQPSTLTVRGVTEDAQTNKVVSSAEKLDGSVKVPQAVAPADTTYRYVSGNGDNSGTLQVADTSSVSLLVDEIVDQSQQTDQQYVQMLKDRAETDPTLLGTVAADTVRLWRFYYMDLVLAGNGNAVLTADRDITIYWPYPDGISYQDAVSGKYSFTMLHYTGLNRNYASDSFATELKDCRVAKYTVTPTAQGLCFTVPAGDGFSPYTLVYEYSTKSGEQSTTVTATPTPDAHPDIADAKANGTWGQPTPTPAVSAVIPQTSDDMPLGVLLGMAGIAAAAVVVLAILRRRRKQ